MNVASSREAGWLCPAGGPDEAALEDALHDMVCGLCGLSGEMVRPRWQPRPAPVPAPEADWCAFGIVSQSAEGGMAWHEKGSTRLEVQETLLVMFSFYGPNARSKASCLRNGLWIEQNRAVLREGANLALVRVGEITSAPELANGRWLKREDISITFTRGAWQGEGATNIQDLIDVQACGLCGKSR